MIYIEECVRKCIGRAVRMNPSTSQSIQIEAVLANFEEPNELKEKGRKFLDSFMFEKDRF